MKSQKFLLAVCQMEHLLGAFYMFERNEYSELRNLN